MTVSKTIPSSTVTTVTATVTESLTDRHRCAPGGAGWRRFNDRAGGRQGETASSVNNRMAAFTAWIKKRLKANGYEWKRGTLGSGIGQAMADVGKGGL